LQEECNDVSRIIAYLRSGELPQDAKLARQTIFQAEDFHFNGGLLYHKYNPRNKHKSEEQPLIEQLVLPVAMRTKVMYQYHDLIGHPNYERMYATIRNKYWWNGMFTDIKKYAKCCEACGAVRNDTHTLRRHL
jgi:hypothetical protein